MLMGCEIPFRKLNFDSLEAFLRSEPSLECKPGAQGMIINARLTEKSAHIARMVSAQKDTGSKRPKRNAFVRFGRRPMHKPSYHDNQAYKGRYSNNYGPHGGSGPPRRQMPPRSMPQNLPKKSPPLVNNNNNVYGKVPANHNQKPQTAPLSSPTSRQPPQHAQISTNDSKREEKQNHYPAQMKSFTVEQQVPHSTRTNRSMLLNQQGSNISPTQLKMESLKAFHPESSVWAFSSDSDSSSPSKKTFEKTGDILIDLQHFLKMHHQPPAEITILKRQIKFRKPQYFDCKIVAGGKTFSNYPKDFVNEDQVTKFTCEKALEELIPLFQSAAPSSSLLVSDNSEVLKRVPPMIELHTNGIWNDQLERLYADKYKEILPSNWLKIIENCPVISVQQASMTRHLLTYCRPEDLLQKAKFCDAQILDQYIHNTVSIAASQLPHIEEGTEVKVEVQCVETAGEIWCRLVGTEEASIFAEKNLALTRAYLDAQLLSTARRPERVIVGGHYIVLHGDDACRVQVLSYTSSTEETALCFYVDYGEAQEVGLNEMFTLEEEFASIQAQAFQCRLQGLEDLYEFSNDSEALMNLVGNEYYMEIAPRPNNGGDEVMGVYLYDIESNDNMNEVLESQLLVECASPYLSERDITDVEVTNVDDSGDIFVQLRPHNPGFLKLMELLGKVNESITKEEAWVKSIPEINKEACGDDKIFIAKSNRDNRYHRIIVNDWEPSGRFLQVLFIDFGYTHIMKPSEAIFYDFQQFSEMLGEFERQALRIRLDIDEVPDNFTQVFTEIIGNSSVLAKRVPTDGNDIPIVKLFKRVLPDNLLASINETIVLNYEKRIEKPTKRELLRTQSKNSPSSGELKTPEIPSIGSFFDVNVPTAVSPLNFFIQPWKSNFKLEKLMESLQHHYNNEAQYSPLSLDDIIPGKVYASRHPASGVWHRTSVTKVINPQSIAVYYGDYGYYDTLHSNQLLPLDSEYLDLPYQAIKAKLTGVMPKNVKWTVGDCELFRKLVTGKQFVSVIEYTETDEFCPSDVVLCLRLVNTRGEHDVNIGDVLVQKDIAIVSPKKDSPKN